MAMGRCEVQDSKFKGGNSASRDIALRFLESSGSRFSTIRREGLFVFQLLRFVIASSAKTSLAPYPHLPLRFLQIVGSICAPGELVPHTAEHAVATGSLIHEAGHLAVLRAPFLGGQAAERLGGGRLV